MRIRFLAVALLVFCSGCSSISALRKVAIPPKATVMAGTTAVVQSGDAQTPSSAKTEVRNQTVILPAGSLVFQNPTTGVIEYRLSKDTPIQATTRVEQATAPASFTPPAPPSVGEILDAKADFWTLLGYRVGVFVGIAAAVFGLVKVWPMVMWGGVAVAAACLFGLFVKSHPTLLIVIGLGIALKFAGPILWHAKVKHLETKP